MDLSHIRCFLLDMDGTVYLGNTLLPGALRLIEHFRHNNISYLFLTNNSSKSREEYRKKLNLLGLDVGEEDILTSGEATALYLQEKYLGARVFLVGTPALKTEFERFGFHHSTEAPDVVVLGFDTTLTYDKLVRLCHFVRAGVPYIATHPDINCPTPDGFIPDTGAMMALVDASTGRRPDVIVGKPNPFILHAAVTKTGVPIAETCMVGDRLYTDIALGKAGVFTTLVLSGEANRDEIPDSPYKPDLVVEDLSGLLEMLDS